MEKSLKFTVSADLHYKKIWYAATVKDMETIFERAKAFNADFVMHEGDLCNDYVNSPELLKACLKNDADFKFYNVYGNHELESENNSMEFVTQYLTNDSDVIWGTENGKIGDGTIGYYYFDKNGYRIICLDTNYAYDPETNEWVHNTTNSHGPQTGTVRYNALGPRQFAWLEDLLIKSANQRVTCIISSHANFRPDWGGNSADNEAVHYLFKKVNEIQPRTIIMQISGHEHVDRMEVVDNIFYFSVNTVLNGLWKPKRTDHYADKEKYPYDSYEYDKEGNLINIKRISLGDVWFAPLTHFFEEPLSADITLIDDNKIIVKGFKTKWRYNVVPDKEILRPYKGPQISDFEAELD